MKNKEQSESDPLFSETDPDSKDDIDSLFGDSSQKEKSAYVSGSDKKPRGSNPERSVAPKRSASDFHPDMDALLITAQSSMIIEAIQHLTACDFSQRTIPAYSEALKGLELFVKIIQRNPEGYRKLANIIKNDTECAEVEKVAFELYRAARNVSPETDDEKLTAYQYFYDKLLTARKKAGISKSIADLKKYCLLSGGLDIGRLTPLIDSRDSLLLKDIAEFSQNIKIAAELLKKGDGTIARLLKGRDTNNFAIKASELLYFFYNSTGDINSSEYYKRLYDNYTKYQIIK